jgi:hypothetical protein
LGVIVWKGSGTAGMQALHLQGGGLALAAMFVVPMHTLQGPLITPHICDHTHAHSTTTTTTTTPRPSVAPQFFQGRLTSPAPVGSTKASIWLPFRGNERLQKVKDFCSGYGLDVDAMIAHTKKQQK